jgi:unsaturated rhamnogalacturonyl hydrolase
VGLCEDVIAMKTQAAVLFFVVGLSLPAWSQTTPPQVTDSGTALHLLQPAYPVPYVAPTPEDISAVLRRVLVYLDGATPARVIDRRTQAEIPDMTRLSADAVFAPGAFRLVSYEWGVTYGAMLLAGDATGDARFADYTTKRVNLIAALAQSHKPPAGSGVPDDDAVRSVLDPRALDDAGSMCAAMIKAAAATRNPALRPLIDRYIDYISTRQLRLGDGTLARNRPFANTLWLDDLYMSVPALAQMGKLTGDPRYFDDAARQVLQFSQRMFNKEKGLFFHGWVQDMNVHPEFYWARCNGWALLAMTELLDVLPETHPSRPAILGLLRSHIRGLAAYQSAAGFWHQLLTAPDAYLETSATAIFTYCVAHAVNKGWIDAAAHGPMAVAGWNAVQTKVNAQGQVEGTCVGTGMAFDPMFYYNRPVNAAAAHGYGPVIMAGAEMIRLSRNYQIVVNDSAITFYPLGANWRLFR